MAAISDLNHTFWGRCKPPRGRSEGKEEELEAVVYKPLSVDDWEVSTSAEQALDPMLVAELYNNVAELETIYGLLVVKDGYLVAEDYFNQGSM